MTAQWRHISRKLPHPPGWWTAFHTTAAMMKTLAGLVRVRSGRISFRGEDISGDSPERVVGKGLCYVPQSANIFASRSIRENLEMGAFLRRDDYRRRISDMFKLFPDLAQAPSRKAHTLSGGQRQMLDPSLLLLDEPSAGLSHAMFDLVFERLLLINRSGGVNASREPAL